MRFLCLRVFLIMQTLVKTPNQKNTMWLIEQSAYNTMKNRAAQPFSVTTMRMNDSISTTSGKTANIQINGILTDKRDFFAALFGGGNTTYATIISALDAAEDDSQIKKINLLIDSPGGTVDGLFETLNRLNTITKPLTAMVKTAASAAFAIATQANKIIAHDDLSIVGGVGVAIDAFVDEDVVSITSTKSPQKRPDLRTTEGQAPIINVLDDIHDKFVAFIANGRSNAVGKKVTTQTVNEDFGQGASLTAQRAIKFGMIDDIASKIKPTKRTATTVTDLSDHDDDDERGVITNLTSKDYFCDDDNNNDDLTHSTHHTILTTEKPTMADMNLATFKATYNALYMEVVNDGLQQGIKQERERVNTHLNYGTKTGAMEVALKAVKDGSDVTPLLISEYLTAGVNKKDLTNHEVDTRLDPHKLTNPNNDNKEEQIAAIVEKQLGVIHA